MIPYKRVYKLLYSCLSLFGRLWSIYFTCKCLNTLRVEGYNDIYKTQCSLPSTTISFHPSYPDVLTIFIFVYFFFTMYCAVILNQTIIKTRWVQFLFCSTLFAHYLLIMFLFIDVRFIRISLQQYNVGIKWNEMNVWGNK